MVDFHFESSMSVVQGGEDFCNVRLHALYAVEAGQTIFFFSQFVIKESAKFYFVAIFSLSRSKKKGKDWFLFRIHQRC
jgi:hypothetical protein